MSRSRQLKSLTYQIQVFTKINHFRNENDAIAEKLLTLITRNSEKSGSFRCMDYDFWEKTFLFFFVLDFSVFFFCRFLFPLVLCNIYSRSFSAIFPSFLCSFLFPFVGQWTQRRDVLGQTVGDLTNDHSSPCYRQLSPLGTLHFRVRPSIRS